MLFEQTVVEIELRLTRIDEALIADLEIQNRKSENRKSRNGAVAQLVER